MEQLTLRHLNYDLGLKFSVNKMPKKSDNQQMGFNIMNEKDKSTSL